MCNHCFKSAGKIVSRSYNICSSSPQLFCDGAVFLPSVCFSSECGGFGGITPERLVPSEADYERAKNASGHNMTYAFQVSNGALFLPVSE